MKLRNHFDSVQGHLHLDGHDLVGLAYEHGTPLMVTYETRLIENAQALTLAFKEHYPNFAAKYAVKANWNTEIIYVLGQHGIGVDASSPGEIVAAELAGIGRDKILFSPNYAPLKDLMVGFVRGVTINFDDLGQFVMLSAHGVPEVVSFRLNPGFGKGAFPGITTGGPDTKFGIFEDDIVDAYRVAKYKGVERFGIHMMAGSNVLDVDHFVALTQKVIEVAGKISRELGIEFEFIDIGGGLGVPYRDGEAPLDVKELARRVGSAFKDGCAAQGLGTPTLMFEPGRYLVADTTVMMGTVNYVKRHSKIFVGTDIGMNNLIRIPLYNAHHDVVLANKIGAANVETVNLVGQICESTDVLVRDLPFPASQAGDVVAFFDAGAYVYSMSSNYGLRPRAAEVMIGADGSINRIRRAETMEDLFNTLQRK